MMIIKTTNVAKQVGCAEPIRTCLEGLILSRLYDYAFTFPKLSKCDHSKVWRPLELNTSVFSS